jgi:hypothetical protein
MITKSVHHGGTAQDYKTRYAFQGSIYYGAPEVREIEAMKESAL